MYVRPLLILLGMIATIDAADLPQQAATIANGFAEVMNEAASATGAASTPTGPQLVSMCTATMRACLSNYTATGVGVNSASSCRAFANFQACYTQALPNCGVGEVDIWKNKYTDVVDRLQSACVVSTTPMNFLSSSAVATSRGSPIASLEIGGLILVGLICCSCATLGLCVALLAGRRKRRALDGDEGYPDDSEMHPMYDQEVAPFFGNMPYPANMPMQPNMVPGYIIA